MPESAGVVFLDVRPDVSGFGSELKRKIGPQLNEAEATTRSFSSKAGGALKTFGKVAVAGLATAGAGAIAFGISSVHAFEEAAAVQAKTTAVLKSTGGQAGVTEKQVAGLAEQIRDLTGVSDDDVQGFENLLLTFTNVRNEAGKTNDIFTQTTRLGVDMSVALGQDLKSSAIQLGKALNDPVKGITALSRVGVSFTQEQKDQVKAMVDAGDTLGAQKLILAEVRKEFGGAAEQIGKTDAGKIAIAKDQFQDLEETLGQQVLPVFAALLPTLQPIIAVVGPALTQVFAAFGQVLQALAPALGPVLGGLAEALSNILIALLPILPPLAELIAAVAPLIVLVSQLAAGIIGTLTPALSLIIGVLANVVGAVVGFLEDWRGVWTAVVSFVGDKIRAVRDVVGRVIDRIAETWRNVWGSIASTFDAVWDGITASLKASINFMIGMLNHLIHGINEVAEKGSLVGLIPGVSIKDIPDIPTLASGGVFSGLALVHRDELLVASPTPTRVVSASETRSMLAGLAPTGTEGGGFGGGIRELHWHEGRGTPDELVDALDWHAIVTRG
jgi:phage-related protein